MVPRAPNVAKFATTCTLYIFTLATSPWTELPFMPLIPLRLAFEISTGHYMQYLWEMAGLQRFCIHREPLKLCEQRLYIQCTCTMYLVLVAVECVRGSSIAIAIGGGRGTSGGDSGWVR